MTQRDPLSTIATDDLAETTGGATRARSSSSDWQLQQTMQTITDSLRDLKSQQSSSSTSTMLPLVMMAKMMRDRG